MEKGLSKNEIISHLFRSEHGNYDAYVPITQKAAKDEPEFLAHLIAYNHKNSQIRDTKVALPVSSLGVRTFAEDFGDNSLAHIASLDPLNLLKAVRFSKSLKIQGNGRRLRRLVTAYLKFRESKKENWTRVAVQYRNQLKELYAFCHVKPNRLADNVLFKGKYIEDSIFQKIKDLKNLPTTTAASIIISEKLPFLVVKGALGKELNNPDLVLAMIENMSATELVTNTTMLEKLGIKNNPMLKAAYEAGLKKVGESKKVTFKTTRAIENIKDKGLKEKLAGAQEKQIKNLGGVEGNWLILCDKSGSMSKSIDTSRLVAGTLAKMVKGEVHLVFFDDTPRYFNAKGKDYDQIIKETKNVSAGGGTSIGCGLKYIMDKNIEVDGIAIVSDGAEHSSPRFYMEYLNYCKKFGKDIPVYFYNVDGEPSSLQQAMKNIGFDLQEFNLRGKNVDYYALPNLVSSMRAQRYSLIDDIFSTPLLKTSDIIKGGFYVG